MKTSWDGNLQFIKNAWDERCFDKCAMIKRTPHNHDKFVLTVDQNKNIKPNYQISSMLIQTFDEETGRFVDRNKIAMNKLLEPALYEQVEMDHLDALLNDKTIPC